jgi:hypothetical protein
MLVMLNKIFWFFILLVLPLMAAADNDRPQFATPVTILAPESGQTSVEISLRNLISSLQSKSPTNAVTDMTTYKNQQIFRVATGFWQSWFFGVSANFTQSSTNTILTDPLNQKTTSSMSSQNLSDPTLFFGHRDNEKGFSMVTTVDILIPSHSAESTADGSANYTDESSKNLTPAITPSITVFTNSLNQLLLGASMSYLWASNSRADKYLLNGNHAVTDSTGGNRSTLSFFMEQPFERTALGLQTSINYIESVETSLKGLKGNQDPSSYVTGQIYIRFAFTEALIIYPSVIYQKTLTSGKNGTQIDINETKDFFISTRYTY